MIREIVKVRNELVAHPTLDTSFKKDYVKLCKELAKKLIIHYLKKGTS